MVQNGLTSAVVSRRLASHMKEVLWPTLCAGCELPGEVLCDSCIAQMSWISQISACPVCGAPHGALVCTSCDGLWHELEGLVCATSYEGVARSVIHAYKDEGEQRLASVLACAMACAWDEACAVASLPPVSRAAARSYRHAPDALCFVPATRRAYARRGFDHMELVATLLAPLLEIPLADVLVRSKGKDQRLLGWAGRAANLKGAVSVIADVSGMHLLLADDVVTTGASMRECAKALLEAGAASVTGCGFARVW